MRRRRVAVIATAVVAALVPSGRAAAAPSVAMQVDPAHSGVQADGRPGPPLRARWSVDLGQPASFPLIAGGRVYVIVRNVETYGTRLVALDESSGAQLWSRALGGTYYWGGAAYDTGRVFTVNYDGVMQALDAASGAALWSRQLPGQYAFSSEPTAVDGVVYTGGAGSGGTLYSVDQASGAVRWTQSVANGDHSSPAVGPDNVFVSYACPNVYDFSAAGQSRWGYHPGCSGGGGRTPVLANGRLYVRDGSSGYVFDAGDGRLLDAFSSTTAPAVAADLGYRVSDGTLEAFDATTGVVRWSHALNVAAPPLVVGGVVYAGSADGTVTALDRHSGAAVWSGSAGAAILPPDEHNVSSPVSGMGAGDGLLVVPAGGRITAFESTGDPWSPPGTPPPNSSTPSRQTATSTAPSSATGVAPVTAPAAATRPTPRYPRLAALRALVRAAQPRLAVDLRAVRAAAARTSKGHGAIALRRALRRLAHDVRTLRRSVAAARPESANGRRGRAELLVALGLVDRGARALARALTAAQRHHPAAARRQLRLGVRLLARSDTPGRRAQRLLGVHL